MQKIFIIKTFVLFLFLIFFNSFVFLEDIGIAKAGNGSGGQTACTGDTCLQNPLGSGVDSVPSFINRIIKAILGIVGSVALIQFVYGGFLVMTSGTAGDHKKGLETMKFAFYGLVIIFTAYVLVSFVIKSLTETPT